MNASAFAETLRDDHETALSRLGSSKALYALTGGEMDAPNVRRAAHDEATTAARVFAEWADSEDDAAAADVFADVAADAESHLDAIGADAGDPDATRPLYETLEGFDDTHARLGGLVGRTLATKKTAEQLVGFFVGDADPQSASTFRGLRDDYDDHLDAALAALDDACETDEEWDAAKAAADATIEAAYGHYVETLESMGVKPKNVC
ncbi:hypothetical protein SAMN04487949_0143 [Halogranum gelatinilyticum]|uniref:Rubrerythrin n=1 Tax=Halogranum gelatinilyticum TaxID=660521 RepID=A0A1G9NYM3_9EURY|nr:transcription antitermination protein [Halogranum gelatinilyticum]SDL91075.1 hypothetical protein SAMN04487949_0143 [Halogranum gelatinilyticum]